MSLSALSGSPRDTFEAVCLADDAIDWDAMAEPYTDPPTEYDTPAGRATWTRFLEYATTRDVTVLRFRPGMDPCRFRLGRLALQQVQAVADVAGEFERAQLAVRYALRSVADYELGPGERLVVERERGPMGEWATWATMERLHPAHIRDLGQTVIVRSGLTAPFRPTLRPRAASDPPSTSAASSTPSGA